MKSKINILIVLSRKAVCIIFMLLISVNFSFGSLFPGNCQGGPDCANCNDLAHSHMPGAAADVQSSDCKSGDKNTTCGFEGGRLPDDANRFVLIVNSDPHEFAGNLAIRSDVYTRPNASGEFPHQFDSPDIKGIIPIFLLNDSLLC